MFQRLGTFISLGMELVVWSAYFGYALLKYALMWMWFGVGEYHLHASSRCRRFENAPRLGPIEVGLCSPFNVLCLSCVVGTLYAL
ncbi:hypothetical protein EDD22DRAFT_280616 [Suillus occidentalis]|nr:hypothetical protein EDD22DRAFT_280616 [Suillus occidentalis]